MSPRQLTDPTAVRRAIEICDGLGREAFARRYGFARSSQYELIHDGTAYDSAAIVAVAYELQHGQPLESRPVRGAHEVLLALGFEIRDLTPPWDEDELVLGLDVYLRLGAQGLDPTEPEVLALSDRLRALAPLRGMTHKAKYRTPTSVVQQLEGFVGLGSADRDDAATRAPERIAEVWARYGQDPEARARHVHRLLNELEQLPPRPVQMHSPSSEPVPATPLPREPRPKVSRDALLQPFVPELARAPVTPADPVQIDARKHDRALAVHETTRMKLARFLTRHGLELSQVRTRERDLQIDLGVKDKDTTWIVEVKSLPPGADEHRILRAGLGQVLWYRSRWRSRCEDPCIAVLCVERAPVEYEAWRKVCAESVVVLTWPERFGSLLGTCATLIETGTITVEPERG